MARPLRLTVPGACFHLIARGNNKQYVFLNDDDFVLFKLFELVVELRVGGLRLLLDWWSWVSGLVITQFRPVLHKAQQEACNRGQV